MIVVRPERTKGLKFNSGRPTLSMRPGVEPGNHFRAPRTMTILLLEIPPVRHDALLPVDFPHRLRGAREDDGPSGPPD